MKPTKAFASTAAKEVEKVFDRSIKLNTEAPDVVSYTRALPPFTGIARSVQCFENNGHRNFRILTLTIENDAVVHTEYSDPYAQWEAISRMDLWNANSLLSLNDSWRDGKCLFKKEFDI